MQLKVKALNDFSRGRLLHISNEAACFIRKFGGGIENNAVFDS